MGKNMILGFFWLFVGGITQGAFTFPMKFTTKWKWENIWLAHCTLAFFVLPWLLTVFTIPNVINVYKFVPLNSVIFVAIFGFLWGCGNVFFGLGQDLLGIALGFAIMNGLILALGAFIPLTIITPDLLLTTRGIFTIAGTFIAVVAIIICSWAGSIREKSIGSVSLYQKESFFIGLVICIFSGIFSPMFNVGFALSRSDFAQAAKILHISEANALAPMWALLLTSGFIANAIYCAYRLWKNHTWNYYLQKKTLVRYLGFASIMGFFWYFGVITYGWGAGNLGKFGPSLGWAFYNAVMILTSTLLGIFMQEWKNTPKNGYQKLVLGIFVLLVSIIVLSMGGLG